MDVDVPAETSDLGATAISASATGTTAEGGSNHASAQGANASSADTAPQLQPPAGQNAKHSPDGEPVGDIEMGSSAKEAAPQAEVGAASVSNTGTVEGIVVEETVTTVEITRATTIEPNSRINDDGVSVSGGAATDIVQQTTDRASEASNGPTLLEKIVADGLNNTEVHEPSNQALAIVHPPKPISSPLEPSEKPATPQRIFRTGYIFDHLMMLHCQDGYTPTADTVLSDAGGHPEEPMRIKRIFSRLADQGLIKRMKRLNFSQVTMDQILLVHTEDHWNKVQGTETLTDQYIQESKAYYDQLSLYVCRETAHCARLSCGGVIHACRAVCQGEVRNAFAIVRPPGHHAEPDEHMGFCFFNNVAVAAKEIQKQGLAKKVLILDWDVHHGNGTQRAFWDDPNVLYVSIHRHDGGKFYPTSDFGALDMVGVGEGEGRTVNIPWPSGGFGDGDYVYAFQKIVMPIAYEFDPDLVIISAGFDAAEGDALGQCNVTPAAYGHMTHMLCALAGGKVVVALEGGYNLEAISVSSLAVAQVLLGETPAELGALQASEVATEVIHQVAKVQSKYWKSIDVKGCEPPEVGADEDLAPVIPIPDLLKIHRAHHMFSKHQLFQIPLASPELEDAFGGQVICNEGVYEAGKNGVLVVFVHDFGNLRVETDGVSTTNVHLTNSYLLDTSDKIVNWVVKSGYSLIDVNVLAQLPTRMSSDARLAVKQGSKQEGVLMRYIWDNYIELSEAERVILIGHGSGCSAVMDLINNRDVQRKVKAVVQVAGMQSIVRIDADNQNRRDWFKKANRIYVPNAHPLLEEERIKKRLGGQIFTSTKAKVVDVLVDVFPQVQEFVESKLPRAATPHQLSNGDGAMAAGPSGGDHHMDVDVTTQQSAPAILA